MFAMAFSTVALIACGDDDKENEEVVDPLETEKEYYIVGTVTATGGALTGAQVDTGNNLTATTDAQGVYMLTVKETGEYNLKFTATDMESMESKVTIAASAANRTQTTLNVKMAKAISFENVEEVTVEADKETNVEAAQNETSAEEAATTTTVSVPAQAAEEGTTIAAVTYEEPKASTSEEVAETPKEEAVPVTAVAIKVTPEDAVAKAPIEKPWVFPGFEDVDAGIVHWPMSCIRLTCADDERLVELADKILTAWRGYTDESCFVYAETDGEPHNTITPIARMRDGKFQLDLVLRNNITTPEHPLGVYHPHAKLHHIKKENIGLIEVMGLAVLPSRLKQELFDLGGELAFSSESQTDTLWQVNEAWTNRLEQQIDAYSAGLPVLRNFILPSGSRAAAQAHVVRTLTRRCERLLLGLSRVERVNPAVLPYLNRLSDWFFTIARYLLVSSGTPEILWVKAADRG